MESERKDLIVSRAQEEEEEVRTRPGEYQGEKKEQEEMSRRVNSGGGSSTSSPVTVPTTSVQTTSASKEELQRFDDEEADMNRRQTSELVTTEYVDAGSPEEREKHQNWARKAHSLFTKTALPTGVVVGLFFLALFLKAKIEAHIVGRILAGYCAVMSILMTGLLIYCHLTAYTNPRQQRMIVRILIMVPVYAVDSFLALWNHEFAPIVGLIRDMYESYVIYTFFHLLMSYLGGEVAIFQGSHRSVKHMAPLCCLSNFPLTPVVLKRWKFLLVQYMIFKPVMSLVAVYLMMIEKYDEADWTSDSPHLWIVVFLNISVTCAFSSLVYFFMTFKVDLEQHKPMGKFAAVKAVVFLTFWQSVALGILVHYGMIKGSREGMWSPDEVSTGVQDFLICLEMLAMCYVHHKVFPETPYVGARGHTALRWWAIRHALSVSDVIQDTIDTAVPDVVANAPQTIASVPGAIVSKITGSGGSPTTGSPKTDGAGGNTSSGEGRGESEVEPHAA